MRLEPEPNSTSTAPAGVSRDDLGDEIAENADLGASWVIFGNVGDLLEEDAALLVVEELAGQRLLSLAEAAQSSVGEYGDASASPSIGSWVMILNRSRGADR